MEPSKENAGNGKLNRTNRDNSTFLNNSQDGSAKTKSNLIQIPSITLPKGGGAMKSIDEKFSVNAANGTAAYNIPLPLSPGRNGHTPSLSLAYNSGSGKDVFGIGWGIDVPTIHRRTEKKLPEYKDAEESDVFIIAGAEDMVPEFKQDEKGNWLKDAAGNFLRNSITENGVTITIYRPRIEGGFLRIEKIEDNGNTYWRTRTRDNIVSIFGKSGGAKLFDPGTEGNDNTFKWCLEYSYDDKGNFTHYCYKNENSDNISAALSEKNRLNSNARFANLYLKGIKYGNVNAFYEGDTLPVDFLFELVLDYGEHDQDKPTTLPGTLWTKRSDPFSNYKAGFEIRTYRLCRRILMFHHFKKELGWDDYLVRSMEFAYDEQPHITYLEQVTQTGYIWNTDGTLKSKKTLPPLEFSYFKPGFSREVIEIMAGTMPNAPIGLDGRQYQWTDLYSEGISGIFSEQGNGWFYKENLGNGLFGTAKLVSPRPSFSGLSEGTLALQELEADGRKYLVKTDGALKGYFAIDEGNEWRSFHPFNKYPNIDLQDPNLKFLDLDGDGMADMLISQAQEFIWYASKGISGYDDYHLAVRAANDEQGPQILFADKDESMLIATADMSGDGLADIVIITYAEVAYYPNLGYGKFGAKVTFEMSGCFDAPAAFNLQNIHFSDIDGCGTTDIIYTGRDKIQVWFNQSGNSLSDPSSFFNPFPELDNQSKISFVDLLGNGTSCMVWSSALPHHSYAPLRYIDMMGGRKPHIMYAHKNNLGKEVTVEYRSSVQYYLDDKKAGLKWITKLPFPVQCVSKMIVIDQVSQTRFANEYNYHHGYYDAIEREFRGFAMVEQRDTEDYATFVKNTQLSGAVNTIEEDLYQPAVITKTWFHTGAYLQKQKLFNQLQSEYYPEAIIKSGQLIDPVIIGALQDYILPEAASPPGLTADEYFEYCRSLKGLPLRQEIYSDEGTADQQMHPYSVTQHNYDVKLLQPRAHQRYAVFLSHEKETLAFNFERNPLDPRIAHSINVLIDPYGNVTEAASIVYGRINGDPQLSLADSAKQMAQYVTYTQNNFTAPIIPKFTSIIDSNTAYRLPVACEIQTWELNAPRPAATFFMADEIGKCFTGAAIKLYEQDTVVNEKRNLEHSRTLFLKDDLTGPMDLGSMGTLGLPYENYILAFTPALLQNIYGAKSDDSSMRNAACYVSSEGDDNYWIKSGQIYFYPNISGTPGIIVIPPATTADVTFAQSNFYLPVAYQDNFGNLTKVLYDTNKLFVNRSIDALLNEANVDAFNYRVLAPYLMRDANGNRAGVRFDELGLVTQTFVMGKTGEFKGDLLDTATAEFSALDQPGSVLEYDFSYYSSNGQLPCRVHTKVREQHYYNELQPKDQQGGAAGYIKDLFSGTNAAQIETNAIWQESYSYNDGSGHEVLKKIQAEPGLAPQRDAQGNLILDPSGNVQETDTTPALRWIGNGRTIYNNKGKPVKQYEPYFDSTPGYNTENELTLLGVTSVLYYDAIGRLIKTVHPNDTFSKVKFDAWRQKSYDENDTVTASKWYTDRINGALGPDEQQAAQQTAVHYHTPTVTYLDSLARPFLVIAHNKTQRSNETVTEEFIDTRTGLDIKGNALSITDDRKNVVMAWKYDMLGNICYQNSMDAGERWMLADVMGKPLSLWDSRAQTFSYSYDALHRPQRLSVNANSRDILFEQYTYGDDPSVQDSLHNLKGKLYKHYDTAGLVTVAAYDFKGNPLTSARQLLVQYNYVDFPGWDTNPVLDTEIFSTENSYDALNRPVEIVAPDNSIFLPQYNEAGLLSGMDVMLQGSATPTHFITKINYDAKRQRKQIYYGNNTTTCYKYDPLTFRLTRLLTTANMGANILQDLNYTYDPVGNITRQFDNAQKTVFYGGQQVNAQSNYIYDALYRLVEGSGREHIGQVTYNGNDNWSDNWCNLSLQPNSPMQLRNYDQKYFYDTVGNITRMQHIADAAWTRINRYRGTNNQLINTSVGGQNYDYDAYNAHGSMLKMPQLQQIDWNFKEEMRHVNLGGGGDAYYIYDSSGQRIRKIIEKPGGITAERIYIGPFEVYRESTAGTITLERQTLHVMDDKQRIAMVDTLTQGKASPPTQLIRYQYGNHLGSACLELDDQAKIISYEEYHPYGTSAYRATDASRQVPAKRYRYTGMERDDETGLNYHSARYYVPWLGRWMAGDPSGIKDGKDIYVYCHDNPVIYSDPNGKFSLAQRAALWLDDKIQAQPFVKGIVDNLDKRGGAIIKAPGAIIEKFKQGGPDAVAEGIIEGVGHLVTDTVAAAKDVAQNSEKAFVEWDPAAQEKVASRSLDVLLNVADLVSLADGAGAAKGAVASSGKALVQGAKAIKTTVEAAADTVSAGRLAPAMGAIDTATSTADSLKATALKEAAPPLMDIVEVKPIGSSTKGYKQMKGPQYTGAKAIGPAAEGGGAAGVATYSRITGQVFLRVREIIGNGKFGKTIFRTTEIGKLTKDELSALNQASGGDLSKFGKLVERRIGEIVSDFTGQDQFNVGKAGHAHGPDWIPTQLPLPHVR